MVLRFVLSTRELCTLLVLSVILGLVASFVMPFMSLFGTREIGMGPLAFGVFMTTTSTSAIFLSTVLSRLSDVRLSRKSVLLGGAVTGALGYLGYALVRDPLLLTAIGVVFLGLSSVTYSQIFACVRDALSQSAMDRQQLPLAINVYRSCFALSWTAGPAVAARVMQSHGFRGTFLTASVLFLLFAALVFFFLPRSAGAGIRTVAPPVPLSQSLREPVLVAHFVGFFLYFVCSTMGMLNLPLLILGSLQGSERDIGIAYGIAPVFELPLMFYVGVLAARLDHARLIRASLALAVLYYVLLAVTRSPQDVYVVQVLSAAIVAVTGGLAITFFQNLLPEQPGTATNLYTNAQRLGSMVGNLVFGILLAVSGHRTIFLICAGLCGLSLFVLLLFRPR